MGSTVSRVPWRSLAGWVALGLAVIALGDAAIRLAPADTEVAAWWPASGLAVAVGLRGGRSGAAKAAGTTLVASVVANLAGGRNLDMTMLFAVANGAEVLTTCLLVLRWNPTRSLSSIALLARSGAAAALGAGVAAVIAAGAVWLALGSDVVVPARAVMSSHLAAVLVFLPFASPRAQHPRQTSHLEKVATGVVLVGVSLLVFAPGQSLPLIFVLFPLLVFMAFRQSLQSCAVQLILVNLTVIASSSAGWGPVVIATRYAGIAPESIGTLIEVFVLSTTIMVYALRITVESRTHAHVAASQARRHLTSVIESAYATAIIETGLDGVIEVFNQGAVSMLGYAEHDVVGRHTPLLFHDPQQVAERAAQLGVAPGFEVLVHGVTGPDRTAERRDWIFVTADGRKRAVSMVVSRVDDADGVPIGFLGIAEDVSAQRRVETLLVRALEHERALASRLRDADGLKADFVSSVSHELRTPMTSVLGYTELLADLYGEALGPEGAAIVARISSSGHRLLALVDDLLTLSRVDAGTLDLAREDVDLREVAEHAVAVLQPLARTDDIEIDLELSADPQVVIGDPSALERVVINLLSNAIKFSRSGGHITLALIDDDPHTATLVVSDTGVGIPADDLAHVFDRFHRASNAVASAAPGTGLGLAIVKSTVEQHGGTVEVSSELCSGTSFAVHLPRRADHLVEVRSEAS